MKDDIFGVIYTGTVGTSDIVAIPSGDHKEFLYIHNNTQASSIWVNFGQSASGGVGIKLSNLQPFVKFSRAEIGNLIDADLHIIAGGTGQLYTIIAGYRK